MSLIKQWELYDTPNPLFWVNWNLIAYSHGTAGIERELRALEHKRLDPACDGILDGVDLLRDDREDVHVDPVELVEARPRARLGQALQELAHRVIVDPVRAVEHHVLLADGFGKVL